MILNRKPLKIASTSDNHTGHRSTPTPKILSTLSAAFPDNAETGELDMIVIAGDFFDKMLQLPINCVTRIHTWIHQFLKLCKKWDIKLRVLEGTPSHDRNQNQLFVTINEISGLNVDLKYVDTLSIEHIEDFGIDVLYLPDEFTTCCQKTQELVQELLTQHGLKQVDYTVMHGMFDFRLPHHLQSKGHSSKFYSRITRKYVLCGHVHVRSHYLNILEAGSSERLTHGEEGEKGHWRIHEGLEADELIFKIHPDTAIYKTVDVMNLEYPSIMSHLTQLGIPDMPADSNIRLHCYKGNEAITSISEIKAAFPHIRFTHKVEDLPTEEEKLVEIEDDEEIVEITEGNITEAVIEMAVQQSGITEDEIKVLRSLLDGIKQ